MFQIGAKIYLKRFWGYGHFKHSVIQEVQEKKRSVDFTEEVTFYDYFVKACMMYLC